MIKKARQIYNDGYMRENLWVMYGDDEYMLIIHRFERAKERVYGKLNNLLEDPIRMKRAKE